MLNHEKVAKDTTKFLAGTVISSISNVLRGIFIAKLLGPTSFGFWNILMLAFRYNNLLEMGLISGMFKLIPINRGMGNIEKAENIKNATFWGNVWIYVTVNLVLIIITLIFSSSLSFELLWGLRVLAIINLVSQLYIFYTAILRTDMKFGLESFSTSAIAVLSLVLLFVFAKVFKNNYIAALISLLTAYSFGSLIVLLKSKYKFPYFVDKHLLLEIFKVGFPIFLGSLTYILLLSIDRWMIVTYLGPTQVGLYAIGISMTSFMGLLPNAFASTLFPRMLEKYGKSNDPSTFKRIVYLPTKINSLMMFYVCGFMAIIMPAFIHYIVPSYQLGLNSAILLSLGTYFLSQNNVASTYLISINKQNSIIYIQLACILISLAVFYLFIKLGTGIVGVAFGTIFVYFIYNFIIIYSSFKILFQDKKEVVKRIFKLNLPFIALVVLVLLLNLCIDGLLKGNTIIVLTIIKLLLFTLFSIPVFKIINKETNVISIVWGIVSKYLNLSKQ